MFLFLKKNSDTSNKSSALIAKERLQNVLSTERNASVAYLDELKGEIRSLVYKYTPSSCVDISACASRNNSLDIKINITNA